MKNWLKKWFGPPEELIPEWYWKCLGCEAGGEGTRGQIDQDSMKHLMTNAHAVKGGIIR